MKGTTAEVVMIFLSCALKLNYCQEPLTVLPETVVDVVNSQAHFHCASTSTSHAIYWEVDGTEARTVQIQARGITFTTTTNDQTGTASVLTVRSSAANNNSEVVCIAVNVENGEIEQRSPTAYLLVQGLLAAPSNLKITSTNLTAIDLNWTPPFTLNITNMDKDIQVYSIRITNHDTGELSVDNSTIPSYTLLSVKAFQCDTFGFQVTGWNSAGEGNISNTVNASFEKPLMLNSPSVANTTVNSSVQFLCEYACISNAVAVWFIEEKMDMDVNPDQLLVRRSSNRDEACKSATPTDTLHFSEILEIHPLISFVHPIPLYCAFILACNNRIGCRPKICFSDLVGEFQVVESDLNQDNFKPSVTQVVMDTRDNGDSSPNIMNLYGIIAGLAISLALNIIFVAITHLLVVKIIVMRAQVRRTSTSQTPNQVSYSEVLQDAIYDQVQTPPDQQQQSDSPEVTTEVCPAYNITFCTK